LNGSGIGGVFSGGIFNFQRDAEFSDIEYFLGQEQLDVLSRVLE
jgi:hypothetical protein